MGAGSSVWGGTGNTVEQEAPEEQVAELGQQSDVLVRADGSQQQVYGYEQRQGQGEGKHGQVEGKVGARKAVGESGEIGKISTVDGRITVDGKELDSPGGKNLLRETNLHSYM